MALDPKEAKKRTQAHRKVFHCRRHSGVQLHHALLLLFFLLLEPGDDEAVQIMDEPERILRAAISARLAVLSVTPLAAAAAAATPSSMSTKEATTATTTMAAAAAQAQAKRAALTAARAVGVLLPSEHSWKGGGGNAGLLLRASASKGLP